MNVEGKEACKLLYYVVHCSSHLGEFLSWFRADGRHFTSLKGTQTPIFMVRWSPTKTAQVCMREWIHVGVFHAIPTILSAERAANSTLVGMYLRTGRGSPCVVLPIYLQICSAFLEMLNLSRLALANPRMTHDDMCSCWRFFYVEIQRLSSSSVRRDTFLYNAGISLLDSWLKYVDVLEAVQMFDMATSRTMQEKARRWRDAIHLVQEMIGRGAGADIASYGTALSAMSGLVAGAGSKVMEKVWKILSWECCPIHFVEACDLCRNMFRRSIARRLP